MPVEIQIQRIRDVMMPTRAYTDAACWDLWLPSNYKNCPMVKDTIHLGIKTAIPTGYHAKLFMRSSFGQHLYLANGTGIIDSDYRGEWIAKVSTHDNVIYTLPKDKPVFQFLIEKTIPTILAEVPRLNNTARGSGGFGSSDENNDK